MLQKQSVCVRFVLQTTKTIAATPSRRAIYCPWSRSMAHFLIRIW